MIPIITPHCFNDFKFPKSIKLFKDTHENYFWNISKHLQIKKQKQICDIQFDESFFSCILDDLTRHNYIQNFILLLLYNNLDFKNPLKFDFIRSESGFILFYYFHEEETVVIPSLIQNENIRIVLSIHENKPSLKIVARNLV